MGRSPDHSLEFLLAFNGRIHHLEKGFGPSVFAIEFCLSSVVASPVRRELSRSDDLANTRKPFVVISGLPGSGKTTLGHGGAH